MGKIHCIFFKFRSLRENDKTALHNASEKGNVDMVLALLDGGADVNAVNEDGRTALHWAIIMDKAQTTL